MATNKCDICGHAWSSHDPEDGKCDSVSSEKTVVGACRCGRELGWMRTQIARLSRNALRTESRRREERRRAKLRDTPVPGGWL